MGWFGRLLGLTWLLTLVGGLWEWWVSGNYQNAEILLLTSVSCVLGYGVSLFEDQLTQPRRTVEE